MFSFKTSIKAVLKHCFSQEPGALITLLALMRQKPCFLELSWSRSGLTVHQFDWMENTFESYLQWTLHYHKSPKDISRSQTKRTESKGSQITPFFIRAFQLSPRRIITSSSRPVSPLWLKCVLDLAQQVIAAPVGSVNLLCLQNPLLWRQWNFSLDLCVCEKERASALQEAISGFKYAGCWRKAVFIV